MPTLTALLPAFSSKEQQQRLQGLLGCFFLSQKHPTEQRTKHNHALHVKMHAAQRIEYLSSLTLVFFFSCPSADDLFPSCISIASSSPVLGQEAAKPLLL